MAVKYEINEIREELDLSEIETNLVNNVVPKPKEFGEPARRNTHFIGPRYILAGGTTNFFFGFISRKITTFEEVDITLISQIGYILKTDGARNREEIFKHWKRGMNSIVHLNTTWTATNFLSYIEHSFSGTITDWYDSLNEYGKNRSRMMETPDAKFKN